VRSELLIAPSIPALQLTSSTGWNRIRTRQEEGDYDIKTAYSCDTILSISNVAAHFHTFG